MKKEAEKTAFEERLAEIDRVFKRRLAEFGAAILAGMAAVIAVKEVFF